MNPFIIPPAPPAKKRGRERGGRMKLVLFVAPEVQPRCERCSKPATWGLLDGDYYMYSCEKHTLTAIASAQAFQVIPVTEHLIKVLGEGEDESIRRLYSLLKEEKAKEKKEKDISVKEKKEKDISVTVTIEGNKEELLLLLKMLIIGISEEAAKYCGGPIESTRELCKIIGAPRKRKFQDYIDFQEMVREIENAFNYDFFRAHIAGKLVLQLARQLGIIEYSDDDYIEIIYRRRRSEKIAKK